MKNFQNLSIKDATTKHLSEIFNLARSLNIKQLPPDQAHQLGFLVSGFQKKDYLSFIHKADYFYILFEGVNLCGFVYTYSSDKITSDEWLNQLIKSKHPAPFVLIKQICIQPHLIGQGLATHLYRHLFCQTIDYPLFAAIVLEPFNQRSIIFHERHGFQKVFERTPPDGIPRGVWKRMPTTCKDPYKSIGSDSIDF